MRKPECALGFGFCMEGPVGARKRCGEGVSVGMLWSSFALRWAGLGVFFAVYRVRKHGGDVGRWGGSRERADAKSRDSS